MMTPEVEAYIGPIMAHAGRRLDSTTIPPEQMLAAIQEVEALRQRILHEAAAGIGTVAGLPGWIHALKQQQDADGISSKDGSA